MEKSISKKFFDDGPYDEIAIEELSGWIRYVGKKEANVKDTKISNSSFDTEYIKLSSK
jgi:hypothetical protein